MNEKEPFGAYIRQKRLEAGFTQKELAEALFVTESTISKWERGLSYPDVSLVPAICQKLNISEHEFFTACDDDQAHLQEKAASRWRALVKGWQRFFLVSYVIALAACFVCNLAVFHTLSWFWIVLTALALSFCVTNLPFLLHKYKGVASMGAASACLLLLLLSCWAYVGGYWLGGSIAVLAVCLVLPWGIWAVWRFYGKHVAPLSLAMASLWVYGLLAVIAQLTGGGWFFTTAFPICTAGLVIVWLYYLVGRIRCNSRLKAGIFLTLTTFAVPAMNCFCTWVLPGQSRPYFSDYLAWENLLARHTVENFSWVNLLVFAIMLAGSLVLLALGAVYAVRQRNAYPHR